MKEYEAQLKNINITKIGLECHEQNNSAIDMYKKLDYKSTKSDNPNMLFFSKIVL